MKSKHVARVDAHCHLDLYQDYQAVITEAERAGIVTIAVTNTPSVFLPCKQLLGNAKFLRPALGLHPELAHQRKSELRLFKDLVPSTRFVGEVGLDYVTQDEENRFSQRQVFKFILTACAEQGNQVLTVHSRRSASDVVSMVGAGYSGVVILHWFSGSTKMLKTALSYGFYFSINPVMTRSESGREIIAAVPPERVLTETDGPFVKGIGQNILRPGQVETVVTHLSSVWKVPEESVYSQIYDNFRKIVTHTPEGTGRI